MLIGSLDEFMDPTLSLGFEHHQAGRLAEAGRIYRSVLVARPTDADAHHLTAILMHDLERYGEGLVFAERAIELAPSVPEYHNTLAAFCLQLKQNEAAIAACQKALQLRPVFAAARNHWGNALRNLGQIDAASEQYECALMVEPDLTEALLNLSNVRRDQGRLTEAATLCEEAIRRHASLMEAHNNLGVIRKMQGKLEEAVTCFTTAIELDRSQAQTHSNLGMARYEQGLAQAAIEHFRNALELQPDFVTAHLNLGMVLSDVGQLTDAIRHCRIACELDPLSAAAALNLGNVLKEQGQFDEAAAVFDVAIEQHPFDIELASSRLYLESYRPGVTLAELNSLHVGHAACFSEVLDVDCPIVGNRRQRPLKVGFVSADLGRHPVGYFLVQVLESLNRELIEATCYSGRVVEDDMSQRLRRAAVSWQRTYGLSDRELLERIRRDEIDILIDLSGHTRSHRLKVFANRAAPIQMTWMGYVGTTGLAQMDYLIADRWQLPTDAQSQLVERIVRLPQGYVCYSPPEYAPDVGPLPALSRGVVTFGSFNYPAKLNEPVIRVWAAILNAVPESRFVARYRGLDDPTTRELLFLQFESQGISRERIELHGRCAHPDLMAAYGDIDIAIDPFPYSGGLTTCEALWMGVPVVSCPGETFASRHSLSHLSNVGHPELVAADLDEYVELAVNLAADLTRLSELRTSLRSCMAASPLCDGRQFTRDFESLLLSLVPMS